MIIMNSSGFSVTFPGTPDCPVCGAIPDTCGAYAKGGTVEQYFPEEVSRLELWSDVPAYSGDYNVSGAGSHVKRCPGCGAFFLYTCGYEYLAGGSEDEMNLERLRDPVAVLKALAVHEPSREFEHEYGRELALALEEADDAVRELVRSGLDANTNQAGLLRWYAEYIAGGKMNAAEAVPFLNDAYRYALTEEPQTGMTAVLPNQEEALPDIGYLGSVFREAGLDRVFKEVEAAFVPPNGQAGAHIGETLVRHRDFLERHPEAFYQILYNACYWYDCPEADRHYRHPLGMRASAFHGEAETVRLWAWAESHRRFQENQPEIFWLRSCRPPQDTSGHGPDRIFGGHGSEVDEAWFEPSGSSIISCAKDGEVIRREESEGTILERFKPPETLDRGDVRRDGRYFVIVGKDKFVRLWELPGTKRLEMPAPEGLMVRAWFAGGGFFVIEGKEIQIWDPAVPKMLLKLPGSTPRLSSDGRRAAWRRGGYGSQPELFITDVKSGEQVLSVPMIADHPGELSPDGRLLVFIRDEEHTAADVWDVETGKLARSKPKPEPRFEVRLLFFSPDSRFLFAAQSDGTGGSIVRIWDFASADESWVIDKRSALTYRFGLSLDSRRFAAGGPWADISVYDLHTREELFRFPDEPAYLNSLRLNRRGTAMVTAFGKYVRVRDLRPRAYKVPRNHRTAVLEVLSSPDGAWFITRSEDEVRVWNPKTGETSLVLRTRAQRVRVSADGRNLTAGFTGAGGSGFESTRDLRNGRLVSRRDCGTAAAAPPLQEKGPFEVRVVGEDSAVFGKGGDVPLAWIPGRVTYAVWAGRRLCAAAEDGKVNLYELMGDLESPPVLSR